MKCFVFLLLLFCAAFGWAGQNQWSSIGPHGVKEQLSGFAFHPTDAAVIFVSGSRGIFRSTDGGSNWQVLDPYNGTHDEFAARIHPMRPDHVIAGGDRIYDSNDRGTFWSLLSQSPDGIGVRGLADFEFDALNPDILYGVHRVNNVVKSTDGGHTWKQSNTGIPCCVTDLEASPFQSGLVYAAQTNAVYRTTNSGATWKPLFDGLANHQIRFLKTDPLNAKIVYAAGSDGIFKSTNAGISWIATGCRCDATNLSIDAITPRDLYAIAWFESAKRYRALKSTDAGATWGKLPVRETEENRYGLIAIAVHPLVRDEVFMTASDGIYRSTNGGDTWRRNVRIQSLATQYIATSAARPGTIFATTDARVFRTVDMGKSWKQVLNTGYGYSGRIVVHPRNANLVAVSDDVYIFLSRNGGTTWEKQNLSNVIISMTFDPARQQYLYASGENGVHKSTDGGSTWRTVNSGLPRQWYQYLMIDPQNNSRLYVLGGKKLYRSDNEGESWRALPTPRQDLRATLLAVDSLGSVYISRIKVGLPNGASILSKSTDQGRSWSTVQEFNNGKYGYIFKLQFDPSDAHTLYVLSQDEGIWVSGDDGRTWGMFDHSRSNSWSKPRDMQARPWGNGDFLIATSEGVSAYSVNVTAGAPEIEALSSAAVKPGESIVISGRNFGSVPGLVQIEGVAAGVRSWSANRIEITAPSNFETGTIRVTTSSGTASNPNLVVRLPDAGRVDPTTGPASGGTRVFLYCPGPYGIYLPLMFGDGLLHQVQFITDDVLSGITPPGTGTVSVRDFCSGSATFTYQ